VVDVFDSEAPSSGKYKSPLLPQPERNDETLITARKAIIARKSQLTQQMFLNILNSFYFKGRSIKQ